MSPAIEDRDVVTIAPLPVGRPVTGDVLAFLRPSDRRLLIHRAIAARPDGWLMKGDNCLTDDGVVQGDHILGLITHIEKAGLVQKTIRRIRSRFTRG